MDDLWEAARKHLKEQISPSGFALWLEPVKAEGSPGGGLRLVCPNPFAQRWLQNHYLPLITRILASLGYQGPVEVVAACRGRGPALVQPPGVQPALPELAPPKNGRPLHRAFTFERFVVGACNRLAYQASQALARNDTLLNGILFLTSGPGLGKSHLSQAVGNFLKETEPGTRILYATAEDFANDMVRSLKAGQMGRFKEKYRQECDVLLLEEVQFLSGKEKIQAELCYTLDALMSRQKRLVFTSCYLPGEIGQLSKELSSRLTGGLITPIGQPDFPTRVQILMRKAEERSLAAPRPVLEYLAEHLTEDVRRLESALDCLAARATLLQEPVTLRAAQEVLHDLKAVESRLSIPQIQKLVGDYFQVSVKDLLGRSRQKKLVRARQVALYFAQLYTGKTVTELGRLFNRSHSSVVHALQTLERDRRIQPRLEEEMKFLEEKLAQAQVRMAGRREPSLRTDA
ncbi:MAG: chromosomal replication initiator protein DnaA [Desulfobaccales bacterium]